MDTARRQRLASALQSAQAAIELDHSDAEAWLRAGRALLELGHEIEARQALDQAVQLGPEQADAWLQLGILNARAGASEAAVQCYERAASLQPDRAEIWLRLGTSTFRTGHIRQAEAPLRRALQLQPDLWLAAVSLATVLERDQRLDEAEALLAPLVQRSTQAKVAMTWAGLMLKSRQPERALPVVRASVAATPASPERALLLHAHGDVLDALGRHEQAFRTYEAANAERGFSWDARAHAQRVQSMMGAFTTETLAGAARSSVPTTQPLFIVGMPRSGTTLLEQMLACHSQIGAAGELDTLRRVGIRLSEALGSPSQWFQQPLRVPAALLDQGAQLYLQVLTQRAGQGRLLVDKMPDNFLHLGLAALMLPGARVIHLRRDPLDSGWSCFRQPFGPGLAWSCSVEGIAAYQKDYRRIMAHWRQVLDLPLLEVDYETLVSEPQATLEQIMRFLDLGLEEACLSPHRSRRLVSTASHAAVQQPVGTRAVGRAQPYHPWLQALV